MRVLWEQKGFTLLELMVALAIFAMLAVTGWQIMDSLTKSRDRAKIQINAMRDLQFAYLQLSQDLAQTSNYVVVPIGISQTNQDNMGNIPKAVPTFILNSQGIVFKRFTMPDPRLASAELSPDITQVSYQVVADKLINSQWDSVTPKSTDNAKTSVLLAGISGAKWTALTPTSVAEFPDVATLQKASIPKNLTMSANNPSSSNPSTNNISQANTSSQGNHPDFDLIPYQQLPKGIQLEFTYQDEPIVWRFALPNQAPMMTAIQTQPTTTLQANPSPNNSSNVINAMSASPTSANVTNSAEREDYR